MFGPKAILKGSKRTDDIIVRPTKKEDLVEIADALSSYKVIKHISHSAKPLEDRERWYAAHLDRINGLNKDYVWSVEFDGKLVGTIGLHDVDGREVATPSTTIINSKYWGKGLAKRLHIFKFQFAFEELGIKMLKGSMLSTNLSSMKAALSVGYILSGTNYRSYYLEGRYVDELMVAALNPIYIKELYLNDEVPKKLKIANKKIEKALEHSREIIEYV